MLRLGKRKRFLGLAMTGHGHESPSIARVALFLNQLALRDAVDFALQRGAAIVDGIDGAGERDERLVEGPRAILHANFIFDLPKLGVHRLQLVAQSRDIGARKQAVGGGDEQRLVFAPDVVELFAIRDFDELDLENLSACRSVRRPRWVR